MAYRRLFRTCLPGCLMKSTASSVPLKVATALRFQNWSSATSTGFSDWLPGLRAIRTISRTSRRKRSFAHGNGSANSAGRPRLNTGLCGLPSTPATISCAGTGEPRNTRRFRSTASIFPRNLTATKALPPPANSSNDNELDRLFAKARAADSLDTSRIEYGFETRLLARTRARATFAAWQWRLLPFFAVITIAAVLSAWDSPEDRDLALVAGIDGISSEWTDLADLSGQPL